MNALHAETSRDYERIAEAIRFLAAHAHEQPSLDRVAARLGLSGPHVQRVFKRFAGVSPKRFLQHLTVEAAKARLRAGHAVFDAALGAGLSGGGRAYDLFIALEGVTPGEFKRGAASVTHGYGETDLGWARIAWTDRGVCALDFVDGAPDDGDDARHDAEAAARLDGLFESRPTPLHVGGTNLQIQVWRALLRIPEGAVVSYADLARHVGLPGAARAVAGAVAANPVAVWIPCHRVLRASGALSGYRWDPVRKQALLAREWARTDALM